MFGSNYAAQFGLAGFPWDGIDPQGGLFGQTFSGIAANGQPAPGVAAPAVAAVTSRADAPISPTGAGSASPSVAALQSGNPLANPAAGALGQISSRLGPSAAGPMAAGAGTVDSIMGRIGAGAPSGGGRAV